MNNVQFKDLLDEALEFKLAGDIQKAIDLLENLIPPALEVGDFHTYIEVNKHLLIIYLNEGQLVKLQPIFDRITPYIKQYASSETKYELDFIYILLLGATESHSPEENLQKLLENAIKDQKMFFMFNAVGNLLCYYFYQDAWEKASEIANKYIPLLDPTQCDDNISIFMYYTNQAYLAVHYERYEDIYACIAAIESNNLQEKVGQFIFQYWFLKAVISEKENNIEEAKSYFDKILALPQESTDIRLELNYWLRILEKYPFDQDIIFYQKKLIQVMQQQINFLTSAERTLIIEQQVNSEIQRNLYIDSLVKTKNRTFYEEEIAKNRLYTQYTVACFDIDKFKDVNDQFGHLVGDKAIQFIVSLADALLTTIDVEFIRYGGDEFVLLFPFPLEEVQDLLQQIIQNIANAQFYEAGEIIPLTISMGVSFAKEQPQTLKELFHQADVALYYAKKNGRNQLQLFQ